MRLRCAYDRDLCAAVRTIFVRAVLSHHTRRARSLGIPRGVKGHRSGAVNVIQRFGGSVNLNIHFHALFIEGVYTRDDRLAPARHELPSPSQRDVERVLGRIHSRLRRLLERRAEEGRDEEPPDVGDLLVHLASASVSGRQALGDDPGRGLEGLFAPVTPERSVRSGKAAALVARGEGFTLHAGLAVPASRRGRLEKLCRYIARPPIATERLSLDDRGCILYELRHPYSDGRTHVVLTPRELLARLCALIPYPRTHLLTYHGVLAPASTWRDEVVPSPRSPSSLIQCSRTGGARGLRTIGPGGPSDCGSS